MIRFVKERLGYGFAGFFSGLVFITLIAKVFKLNNLSAYWLLLAPLGLILGLVFPKQSGNIFIDTILFRGRNLFFRESKRKLNLEEVQTGLTEKIVFYGGVFLILLIFIFFLFVGLFGNKE